MKKVYLVMLSLILLVAFNACTDDEGNVITNPAELVPTMTATVNGVEWKASVAPAGVDSAGLIIVTGVNIQDSTNITFTFENVEEKTYNLGDSTSEVIAVFAGGLTQTGLANSGSITVTKYSVSSISSQTLMNADFNFTTDTILFQNENVITNGNFSNVVILKK